MRRQVYLAMKTLEEARAIFLSRFGDSYRTGDEEIGTENALGRVTAEAVFARCSSPPFHSAAMDGIAVRAEETYGTTERDPKVLKMGRDALWINTGQPLPAGYDSVLMVERIHVVDEDHVEIRAPAYPWENVRKVGEDVVATELLFPRDHLLRSYDLGTLISAGVFELRVWQRPKVAVIPTGTELIDFRDFEKEPCPEKGKILEYNSHILAGRIRECHGVPERYEIVPDRTEKIHDVLVQALESDAHVVLIIAGSSAGSKDYTMGVIRTMGQVLVHGVTMMPGKPTILAEIQGRPVVGIPGYPVSATLSFDQFVRPLLYRLQGLPEPSPALLKVKPTRDIPSKLGIEEFLRVNIGKVENQYVATPLARSAGSITTLTRAEGLIRIPRLSEGISQDQEINAELLVPKEEVANTVVFVGSHDMTIDLLADEVRRQGQHLRISSANVGSLGGLLALRKRLCHLAGSHLLDPETGEYNLTYIKKYLPGVPVTIYHLVLREQGLILPKGNPKGIRGIEDLTREGVKFVNRQAGSGTRVLLDYTLQRLGIGRESIQGYRHEEFTHMAIAVDVLSGAADCGMGIYAAAKALDLDFLPIAREQYDLILPASVVQLPGIKIVLKTIRSERFRERVMALGGYDPSRSGELRTDLGG